MGQAREQAISWPGQRRAGRKERGAKSTVIRVRSPSSSTGSGSPEQVQTRRPFGGRGLASTRTSSKSTTTEVLPSLSRWHPRISTRSNGLLEISRCLSEPAAGSLSRQAPERQRRSHRRTSRCAVRASTGSSLGCSPALSTRPCSSCSGQASAYTNSPTATRATGTSLRT